MAITRITSLRVLQQIPCSTATAISVDDYLYQGTIDSPTWEAVVYQRAGNTLHVFEFKDTYSAGTIYNQAGSSVTGGTKVDSTLTPIPTRAIVVYGSDATKTNNFKLVADAWDPTDANANGVVRPSYASQTLTLDTAIWFGWRKQGYVASPYTTDIICENEYVAQNNTHRNNIRVIGTASYPSSLRIGNASYTSSETATFPPYRTFNGCKLTIDGGNVGYSATQNTSGISNDIYSTIRIFDTTLTGVNGSGILDGVTIAGTIFIADSKMESLAGFQQGISGISSTSYIYNLNEYNCILNPVYGSPIYCDKWNLHDRQYYDMSGYIYSILAGWEAEIKGIGVFNSGVITTNTDQCWGQFAGFALHTADGSVAKNKVSGLGYEIQLMTETSLGLTVVGEDKNPIQGATVTIKDKYGYNIIVQKNGFGGATDGDLPTTTFRYSGGSGWSVGDYMRVLDEFVYISNVSAPNLTVVRGQMGTTARYDNIMANQIAYKLIIPTTDANGQVSTKLMWYYYDEGDGPTIYGDDNKNDFTLTIKKSGYKTYTQKFTLIDGNPALNWKITLKKNRFREQKSLP